MSWLLCWSESCNELSFLTNRQQVACLACVQQQQVTNANLRVVSLTTCSTSAPNNCSYHTSSDRFLTGQLGHFSISTCTRPKGQGPTPASSKKVGCHESWQLIKRRCFHCIATISFLSYPLTLYNLKQCFAHLYAPTEIMSLVFFQNTPAWVCCKSAGRGRKPNAERKRMPTDCHACQCISCAMHHHRFCLKRKLSRPITRLA